MPVTFGGRLDDIGQDRISLISDIVEIFSSHAIETEIIETSIRNEMYVTNAVLTRSHIATVPYNVFMIVTKNPLTDNGIGNFFKYWEGVMA